MRVILVFASAPRLVHELVMDVPQACSVRQAVDATGWWDVHPELASDNITWGIWGRKADLDTGLREDDRVEAYRSLRVDPKVARRERFSGQGARGAGLFSKRRPGSKAGY